MNGKCKACGHLFVGLSQEEYNSSVAHHIKDNHRDQPPDKVLVEII